VRASVARDGGAMDRRCVTSAQVARPALSDFKRTWEAGSEGPSSLSSGVVLRQSIAAAEALAVD
jgi:hypothetical protein